MKQKIDRAAWDLKLIADTVRQQTVAADRFLSIYIKASATGAGTPRFKGTFFKSLHGPQASEEDQKVSRKAYLGIVACQEESKSLLQGLKHLTIDCDNIGKEVSHN